MTYKILIQTIRASEGGVHSVIVETDTEFEANEIATQAQEAPRKEPVYFYTRATILNPSSGRRVP